MHIVQQEHPLAQPRDEVVVGAAVHARRGAFQTVQQPLLVALGLQAADEPGARVAQGLVVNVHGVLGDQHQPDAEGPGLLEHPQQRRLGGRVGRGRQVAVNLVEIEQRAQHIAAGLGAHPGFHRGKQQRDEEHALAVAQVGQVEHAVAGLALGRPQQAGDVQGHALQPGLEGGRGQDVVQPHGQGHPLAGREEGFQVEHPQFVERWVLHLQNQFGQAQIAALGPRVAKDVGQQNVLARLQRVHLVQAHQPQQRGHRAVDALQQQFLMAFPGDGRCGQRGQDGNGHARVGAGGEDGERDRVGQLANALGADAPPGQALAPAGGQFCGFLRHGLALAAGLVGRNPGRKVLRAQVGEMQPDVGQVALGVNEQRGHLAQRGFLQQGDGQARLARTGHAHDERVGGQVVGVVEDGLVEDLPLVQVVAFAQKPALLAHGVPPANGGCLRPGSSPG